MEDRFVLPLDRISPVVHAQVDAFHRTVVERVAETVARDRVVLVGMAQNPVVKKARKLLDTSGVPYTYLEYGSYLSMWKPRLAIKLWARFPTFPMVFIDGVLEGGHADLVKLVASGELHRRGVLPTPAVRP